MFFFSRVVVVTVSFHSTRKPNKDKWELSNVPMTQWKGKCFKGLGITGREIRKGSWHLSTTEVNYYIQLSPHAYILVLVKNTHYTCEFTIHEDRGRSIMRSWLG